MLDELGFPKFRSAVIGSATGHVNVSPIISVAKVAKSDCVTEKSDCVTDASFKKKGYPSISFLSNDDCYIHHTQLKSFLKCQT